jgi:endonuclease/exonuclease/phosphatase family metal-dependent hydrolase
MNIDESFPDKKNEIYINSNKNLKILSWNIYMLPYINFLHKSEERAYAIGDLLKYENYDILVFQEAFLESSRKIIYNELKKIFPYQTGPINTEKNYFQTNSGLWILSKMPLKLLKSIQYRDAKGFDAIANKGAVLLKGKWQNKNFQLIATHLQADGYSNIRRSQILQLADEIVKPFKNKDIPQIFCGDFNIRPVEFEDYKFMTEKLESNNDFSFSLKNISYDEINNELAKTKNPLPSTFDYIMINKELANKINIKRNLKKFRSFSSFSKQFDLSDHYAIDAEITL